MRVEITRQQIDIVALNTELAKQPGEDNELRLQKAGRLYLKRGARHTKGVSRSRGAYQTDGAAYLAESVRMTLRERKVQHVDHLCGVIMDAARPGADRLQQEPNRFLVRHARVMARIIQMADRPAARPLGFEAAVGLAAEHFDELSRLDGKAADTWWAKEVGAKLAAARGPVKSPDLAVPDLKHTSARQRLTPPPLVSEAQQSSSSALHNSPASQHDHEAAGDGAERKHGPKPFAAGTPPSTAKGLWVDTTLGQPPATPIAATPGPLSSAMFATRQARSDGNEASSVLLHDARAARRAESNLKSVLSGVYGAHPPLEFVKQDEVPHFMSLMRKRMDALLVSAGERRDAKGQAQDLQAWQRLARFCGEACIDDGAGTHAFTRAQVVQLPLKHRLNMLAAMDVLVTSERADASGRGDPDNLLHDLRAGLDQQQGLMGAFTDKELLPPSDEIRVQALKAKLTAIEARNPGAVLTKDIAQEIVEAHRQIYKIDTKGKPVSVVASSSLKPAFEFSADRQTLQVSTAPRSPSERPATVVRQLVAELTRDYQQQLVLQLNNGTLGTSDDRDMLAVILQACQSPTIDSELPAGGADRAPATGAPSRHANLHAALAVGR